MKRSRRVVLTLMGSAAVGAVSMGFVRRRDCGPGMTAVPGPDGRPYCRAAYGGFGGAPHRIPRPWPRPWPRPRRMAAASAVRCNASSAPSATTGAPPPRAPDSIFTPSTASAIGTSAPITPSRSTRSNARSRRRPARSTRCASNSSASAIDDEDYLRRLKIPEAFWPLISRKLAPRRGQPLWPARPQFRRPRPGKTAGIQRGYADLDLRGRGVSMDLARTGDRAAHHPEARRPVQFDP